jgi:predicted aspartyl protease
VLRYLYAALTFGLLGSPALNAQRAVATASTPAALSTVPFRYVHHEIVVNVRIGGSGPYTFMLDTGTTPTVIDAALAKRLRLRPAGAAGSGSDLGGGGAVVHPVTLHGLRFGSVTTSRVNALATDVSAVGKQLGVHLDGVLGSDFFDGRVVQIDYPCRTVSVLSDAVLAPFTARFTELPSGWIVTNDVWINGRRIKATIDTGNSGTPVVTARGITTLRLQAAARAGKRTGSFSYGGRHSETEGVLHDIRIGPIRLGTSKARFLASSKESFDVNIGNRALQRYTVTFDYVRGLLTIAPPALVCPGGSMRA